MTKQDEIKFYKDIKPFILQELSFEVTDYDRNNYRCNGDKRVLVERDKYNIETQRIVLGQQDNELIEYRIQKTPMPYKYINPGYIFEDSVTEGCWAHVDRGGKLIINCYERTKHKTNCCHLCFLCDAKTNKITSFNRSKHNASSKHFDNITLYKKNFQEYDDLVGDMMLYYN
jgi:hypothetical protein